MKSYKCSICNIEIKRIKVNYGEPTCLRCAKIKRERIRKRTRENWIIKHRESDKKYQQKKRRENKKYKRDESKRYRLRFPEKVKAHQILFYAVKKGKIKKSPCVDCGATYRIQGHHPDYSKPLEIIWVCSIHHKNYH